MGKTNPCIRMSVHDWKFQIFLNQKTFHLFLVANWNILPFQWISFRFQQIVEVRLMVFQFTYLFIIIFDFAFHFLYSQVCLKVSLVKQIPHEIHDLIFAPLKLTCVELDIDSALLFFPFNFFYFFLSFRDFLLYIVLVIWYDFFLWNDSMVSVLRVDHPTVRADPPLAYFAEIIERQRMLLTQIFVFLTCFSIHYFLYISFSYFFHFIDEPGTID